ncbi:MAG: hypothetical protein RIS64_3483 [Bacteroidota bacterium]|jgi:uncharacterized damage-inducible protein DinB
MKKLVADYARYNLWANERVISVLKEMDTSLIDKDLGSSFPSIRQTLLHIWDVETLWLQRLKGENPTAFPSKTFTGSHEDIYEGLIAASRAFIKHIEEVPATSFTHVVPFRTFSYGEAKEQIYNIMHHCLNHSTHHRGQVITMMRQCGVTQFPPLDFIFYRRDKNK